MKIVPTIEVCKLTVWRKVLAGTDKKTNLNLLQARQKAFTFPYKTYIFVSKNLFKCCRHSPKKSLKAHIASCKEYGTAVD